MSFHGLLLPPRRAFKSLFRKLGFEVHRLPSHNPSTPYEPVYPRATYAPWRGDRAFLQIYRQVQDRTLVDIYRLWELWTLVEQAAKAERVVPWLSGKTIRKRLYVPKKLVNFVTSQ